MRKIIFCFFAVSMSICAGISSSVLAGDINDPKYNYIRPFISPLVESAIRNGTFGGFTVRDPNTGAPIVSFNADKGWTTLFRNGRVDQTVAVPDKSGVPLFISGETQMTNGWFYSYTYTVRGGERCAEEYIISDEYHRSLGTILIQPNPLAGVNGVPLASAGEMCIIAEAIFGKAKGISDKVSPMVYLDSNLGIYGDYFTCAYRASINSVNISASLIEQGPKAVAKYLQDIFGDIDKLFSMIDSDRGGEITWQELLQNPVGALLAYMPHDSQGNYYLITSLPPEGFTALTGDEAIREYGKRIYSNKGYDCSGISFDDLTAGFDALCEIIVGTEKAIGVVSGDPSAVVIHFTTTDMFNEGAIGIFGVEDLTLAREAAIIKATQFGAGYYDENKTLQTGGDKWISNDLAMESNSVVSGEFIEYITRCVNEAANGGSLSPDNLSEEFLFTGSDGRTYRLEVRLEVVERDGSKGIKIRTRCVVDTDAIGGKVVLGNDAEFTEGSIYDVSRWQAEFFPGRDSLAQQLLAAFRPTEIQFNGVSTVITMDMGSAGNSAVKTIDNIYGELTTTPSSIVFSTGAWQDSINAGSGITTVPREKPVVEGSMYLNNYASLFFDHGYLNGCSVRVFDTGITRVSYDNQQRELTWYDFSGDPYIAYSVESGVSELAQVWQETGNGYYYTYQPVTKIGSNSAAPEYKIQDENRNNLFSFVVEDSDGLSINLILTPQQVTAIVGRMTAKLEGEDNAVACPVIYFDKNLNIIEDNDESSNNFRYRVRISKVDISPIILAQGSEAVHIYLFSLLGDYSHSLFYVVTPTAAGENAGKEYLLTSLPDGGFTEFDSNREEHLAEYSVTSYDDGRLIAKTEDFNTAYTNRVVPRIICEGANDSGMELTQPMGAAVQLDFVGYDSLIAGLGVSDANLLTEIGNTYRGIVSGIGIRDEYEYGYTLGYTVDRPWNISYPSRGYIQSLTDNLHSGSRSGVEGGLGRIIVGAMQEQDNFLVLEDFVLFLNAAVSAADAGETSFSMDINGNGSIEEWETFTFGSSVREFVVAADGTKYKLEIKLDIDGTNLKVYTRCVALRVTDSGATVDAPAEFNESMIADDILTPWHKSGIGAGYNVIPHVDSCSETVTPQFSLAGQISIAEWKELYNGDNGVFDSDRTVNYNGQDAAVRKLWQSRFGILNLSYSGHHASSGFADKGFETTASDILGKIGKTEGLPQNAGEGVFSSTSGTARFSGTGQGQANSPLSGAGQGQANSPLSGAGHQGQANSPLVTCGQEDINMSVSGGYSSSGAANATLTVGWPAFTGGVSGASVEYWYRLVKVDGTVASNNGTNDGWINASPNTLVTAPMSITLGPTYVIEIQAIDADNRIVSKSVSKQIDTYVAAPVVSSCVYNRSNQSTITLPPPAAGVSYKYAVYTDPSSNKTWVMADGSTLYVPVPAPTANSSYAYIDIVAVNTETGAESAPETIRPYTAQDILYMLPHGSVSVWRTGDMYNGEMSGDVNGDGLLNGVDYQCFILYFNPPSNNSNYYLSSVQPLFDTLEEEVLFLQRADVNGDGVVTEGLAEGLDGEFLQDIFLIGPYQDDRSAHGFPPIPFVYSRYGKGIEYPYSIGTTGGIISTPQAFIDAAENSANSYITNSGEIVYY